MELEKSLKLINCLICETSFSTQTNLKIHVKSVHEKYKPHKCSICDYSCSLKEKMKVHVESVR